MREAMIPCEKERMLSTSEYRFRLPSLEFKFGHKSRWLGVDFDVGR